MESVNEFLRERFMEIVLSGRAKLAISIGGKTIIGAKFKDDGNMDIEQTQFVDKNDTKQIICEILRAIAPEELKSAVVDMFINMEPEEEEVRHDDDTV